MVRFGPTFLRYWNCLIWRGLSCDLLCLSLLSSTFLHVFIYNTTSSNKSQLLKTLSPFFIWSLKTMKKQSVYSTAILLFLLFIISSSKSSARFLETKQGDSFALFFFFPDLKLSLYKINDGILYVQEKKIKSSMKS